jgi:hypothetical protein
MITVLLLPDDHVGLTRPPDGRCSFEGAATWHSSPCPIRCRARPNPVGPVSYVTATGPGSDLIHEGVNRKAV